MQGIKMKKFTELTKLRIFAAGVTLFFVLVILLVVNTDNSMNESKKDFYKFIDRSEYRK